MELLIVSSFTFFVVLWACNCKSFLFHYVDGYAHLKSFIFQLSHFTTTLWFLNNHFKWNSNVLHQHSVILVMRVMSHITMCNCTHRHSFDSQNNLRGKKVRIYATFAPLLSLVTSYMFYRTYLLSRITANGWRFEKLNLPVLLLQLNFRIQLLMDVHRFIASWK